MMNTTIRDTTENIRFFDLIETAIDKLEQAVSNISYPAFPHINKDVAEKIGKTIAILYDVLNSDIYKPI